MVEFLIGLCWVLIGVTGTLLAIAGKRAFKHSTGVGVMYCTLVSVPALIGVLLHLIASNI